MIITFLYVKIYENKRASDIIGKEKYNRRIHNDKKNCKRS